MAIEPESVHASVQWAMIILHDSFKRGFESMKKHLASLPDTDAELHNFIGYCWAWADIIDHHNDTEEKLFFPWANTKLDFSPEHEQHELIHSKLFKITEYLDVALADSGKFDGAIFNAMLDDIKEPLYIHLDEEVEHLGAKHMSVFSEQEVLDFNQSIADHIKANDDPTMGLCYLKSHMPPELKDSYPVGLPWFVKKILIPYVFGRKHAGYWKYSPYKLS